MVRFLLVVLATFAAFATFTTTFASTAALAAIGAAGVDGVVLASGWMHRTVIAQAEIALVGVHAV